MVEIADIKDRNSLEKWLDGQSREVSIWFPRRAALRVLPFYWDGFAKSDVTEKPEFSVLPVLRFYLISEPGMLCTTSDIMAAARSATVATTFGAARSATAATAVAVRATTVATTFGAARSATVATAAAVRATTAFGAVRAATAVVAFGTNAAWKAIRQDCEAVAGADKDKMAELELDRIPLWHDAQNPLQQEWDTLKQTLTHPDQPLDWGFWIKWYDSVLTGEPLNGDMLVEIAQIEDDIWQQGEAVALKVINEIWLRYEVADRAQDADRELAKQKQIAIGIGHNRAPEEIEEPQITDEDMALISDVIGQLKDADAIKGQGKEKTEAQISRLRVWLDKAAESAKNVGRNVKSRAEKDAGGAIYIGLIVAGEKLLEALVSWLLIL